MGRRRAARARARSATRRGCRGCEDRALEAPATSSRTTLLPLSLVHRVRIVGCVLPVLGGPHHNYQRAAWHADEEKQPRQGIGPHLYASEGDTRSLRRRIGHRHSRMSRTL